MFSSNTKNPRLPFGSITPSTTHSSPEIDSFRLPTSKDGHDSQEQRAQRKIEEGKMGPPELNIITNFSKPKAIEAAGSLRPQSHEREDSIQHRRKRSREQNPAKGPVDHLKSAENRVSELSPSDRDLMIGISMSSMSNSQQKKGVIVERDPNDEPKSANPEIIITPAYAESPWSQHLAPADNRRRATSSIYSRATNAFGIGRMTSSPKSIPPVPALPQLSATSDGRSRSRVTSWAESDDDAETRHDSLARPESRESQTPIMRRNSFDTIATKYRSQGWWDKILTPFLDRSNTQKTNHFDTPTPKIPSRFEGSREVDIEDGAKKHRETGHTSAWFDKNRETLAFFRDNDSEEHESPPPLPSATVWSPEYEEHTGIGAASEYYEASWHDFHSADPYFKCQNHECSYGSSNYQRWKMVTSPVEGDPVTEGNMRGLITPGPVAAGMHATNKGDKAGFEDAGLGNERRISGTSNHNMVDTAKQIHSPTVIDEDSPRTPPSAKNEATKDAPATSPVSDRATTVASTPALVHDRAIPVASPSEKNSPRLPTPPLPPPPQPPTRTKRTSVMAPVPIVLPPPRLSEPVAPPAAATSRASYPESPLSVMPPPPGTRAMPTEEASPGALTPGLQRDIASHNAMPMEQPRAAPQPPRTLAVPDSPGSEYRAPPPALPPRTPSPDVSREVLSPSHMTHASSKDALRSHPSTYFGATYPGGGRAVSPVSGTGGQSTTINQHFAASRHSRDFSERGYSPPPGAAGLRAPPPAMTHNSYPPPPRPQSRNGESWSTRSLDEKKEAKTKGPSIFSRLLGGLLKSSKVRSPQEKKKKRLFIILFGVLFAVVILIIILVLTLTMKHSAKPVESSWLNLTSYPPIPTGVSTIAQTELAESESGCVAPKTMWSCALPKEEQKAVAPNKPNQPNFRLEIRFQNGTNLTNSSDFSKRDLVPNGGLSAKQFVRNRILHARAAFSNSLFSPSPAPPSQEDQDFLGNSTDGIQAPFGGEATPFYISFLSLDGNESEATKRSLFARQSSTDDEDDDTSSSSSSDSTASNSTTNSTDPVPDIDAKFPPPSTNSDGTASPAMLLPQPSSQPLKLYNRGRSDEHFGFYTYFDRSIFLRSATVANLSSVGEIPADKDGGAEIEAASLRCTWPQTRFLVQIWTNTGDAAPLLGNGTNSTNSDAGKDGGDGKGAKNATSAEWTQPGSFPYPVTVTLDRHGGQLEKKNVYCYGMDDRQHILDDEKQFQLEDREFGGTGVNPSGGLFGNVNITKEEGGPGGIDGGTGGCMCQWKNFQSN